MAPKKPFEPAPGHLMTVGEAHQFLSTISAYGKVISGVTIDPSEAGTVHPQGKDEPLQLALVFGTSDQGKCVKLTPPQRVYMPAPNGPADGCGWDPKKFVVWKNLPKDWDTVHVNSETKPLAAALQPRAMAIQPLDAAATPQLEDVLKNNWLKSTQPPHIAGNDQLGGLWTKFGPGGDFDSNSQNLLAEAISNAFGVDLVASTLTASTTFSQLQQMVGTD